METKVQKMVNFEFEMNSKYWRERFEEYFSVIIPLKSEEIERLRSILKELFELTITYARSVNQDFGDSEDDFSNSVHYRATVERSTIWSEWANRTFLRFCSLDTHPVFNDDTSDWEPDLRLMIVRKHDMLFEDVHCDENCFVMWGDFSCQKSSFGMTKYAFDIRDTKNYEMNKNQCIKIYTEFLARIREPLLHSLRSEWKVPIE